MTSALDRILAEFETPPSERESSAADYRAARAELAALRLDCERWMLTSQRQAEEEHKLRAALAAERERCAKIAEEHYGSAIGPLIAAAIRSQRREGGAQ